jgi:hypothetical protein
MSGATDASLRALRFLHCVLSIHVGSNSKRFVLATASRIYMMVA